MMKKFGFGAMRLPIVNPEDKTTVDQEELNKMVDAFLSAGFTYFDTAYPYHEGMSEVALKRALVDRHAREEYVFADKMPTILVKCEEEYPLYFAEQLKKTGVEYFDYYLMHNMGKDRYAKTQKLGGFAFGQRMKETGKIKNFGFSFHDEAQVLDRILTEHPEVDFVQLQINYLDWDNEVIQSRKCYETAVAHGKPVIVMEPVRGGVLADLPEEARDILKAYDPQASSVSYALRFAAGLEHVMMVLSGMSSLAQVEENTELMSEVKSLSAEELRILEHVTEIIRKSMEIPCTSCGYCMEVCPRNIAIPGLFGVYNNYKTTGNFSGMYHNRMVYGRGKASDCVGCRRCEHNCPQHIAIPEYLEKIAAFEK